MKVATIDFHVTAACTQNCAYCWGPPQTMPAGLDTQAALAMIDRVRAFGVRRIVFTGGDPLLRRDIVRLIRHAQAQGLEVAVSTTGDRLTHEFLVATAGGIDLISLPLDGSSEAVNARTKQPGHFAAIMETLELLRGYPFPGWLDLAASIGDPFVLALIALWLMRKIKPAEPVRR